MLPPANLCSEHLHGPKDSAENLAKLHAQLDLTKGADLGWLAQYATQRCGIAAIGESSLGAPGAVGGSGNSIADVRPFRQWNYRLNTFG